MRLIFVAVGFRTDLGTANLIYLMVRKIKEKAENGDRCGMNKTDRKVLELLSKNGPLTLNEIAEKLDMKPKAVFRSLRRLFEKEMISSDPRTRKYFIEKGEQ